jgi:hypothetical protein
VSQGPSAPTSHRSTAILSPADRVSFARLQSQLGGPIGAAVTGVGIGRTVQHVGDLNTAVAWSTSKTPIAMAIYDAGLAGAHASDLRAAITASDNDAAERLWSALGSGTSAAKAADEELRAAGDSHTLMQPQQLRPGFTPFGQTSWKLTDQARFTAGMTCTSSGRSVLDLMGQTIAGQRWGLGTIGSSPKLKGGWGPGISPGVNSGYLDRQMGIVRVHGKPLVATIATLPANGDHGTGTAQLTTIAHWLATHADVSHVPSTPNC